MSIFVEKTWDMGNVIITKTWEVSDLTGKKYDCIFCVDTIDGDNINCFHTFKDAKKCAKEYLNDL